MLPSCDWQCDDGAAVAAGDGVSTQPMELVCWLWLLLLLQLQRNRWAVATTLVGVQRFQFALDLPAYDHEYDVFED